MAIASIMYFDQFPDDLQVGKSTFDFQSNQAIPLLYLKANAGQPLAFHDQATL
jgi:hypothetical protein